MKLSIGNIVLLGALGFAAYKLSGSTPPPPSGTPPPDFTPIPTPGPSPNPWAGLDDNKVLTRGQSGAEVRRLQQILNADLQGCKRGNLTRCQSLGTIAVDGQFGPATEALLFALHGIRQTKLVETGMHSHNLRLEY